MGLYLASPAGRLQAPRRGDRAHRHSRRGVDEAAVGPPWEAESGPIEASEMVEVLKAKAEAIVGRRTRRADHGLILGGDSAFLTGGGRIHGKPHGPDIPK